MCDCTLELVRAARGHFSYLSYTPCPQWPYCEKRCSYCNFNKYVSRGVEEVAVRSCLVTEAQTLLRLSGVRRWVLRTGGGPCQEWWIGQVQASQRKGSPRSHLLHPLSQGGVCVFRWGHPQSSQSPHCGFYPGGSGPSNPPACGLRSHVRGQPHLSPRLQAVSIRGSRSQQVVHWPPGNPHQPPYPRALSPSLLSLLWSHSFIGQTFIELLLGAGPSGY